MPEVDARDLEILPNVVDKASGKGRACPTTVVPDAVNLDDDLFDGLLVRLGLG